MISFSETFHEYDLVGETESYQHFYNPKMLSIYSCNILKFKRNPTLEEYIVAENKLIEFQLIMNQDYIFLYTVENEPFSKKVEHYLLSKNYSIAGEELLSIDPKNFFFKHSNEEVTVVLVQNNSQLKDYLDFMYQLNLKNGISFAQKKQIFYLNRFYSSKIQQINAYLDGKVVGTANIIVSVPFIEIDHFEVAPTSQNKGIGTEIQKFIMSLTKDKKIILVVDKGTDANNMYYHQHYQFSGYQMSAFKKITPSLLLDIPQTHPSSNPNS